VGSGFGEYYWQVATASPMSCIALVQRAALGSDRKIEQSRLRGVLSWVLEFITARCSSSQKETEWFRKQGGVNYSQN
jgi:hypothetical protein